MRSGVGATVLAIVAVILLAVPSSAFAASDTTADSGTTSADMVTYTGELAYQHTTNNTESVKVLVIKAHRVAQPDSSGYIWYYDTTPGEFHSCNATYDKTKQCWTFSISVPVIEEANTYYFMCVQDGYRIYAIPTDTMAYRPQGYTEEGGRFDPYTLNPDETLPDFENLLPYSAYRIIGSEYDRAGETVDLTRNARIILQPASVTIKGSVASEKNYKLSNVEISLAKASNSNQVFRTTTTNSEGEFAFSDVPTGEYILSATVAGYSCEPFTIDVQDNAPVWSFPIAMTQDADTQYFGFDLPHFLMLLGGVVCVILILASAVFQHRARRGKRDQWIADDTEE